MAQFASDPAFVAAHATPLAIHFKPIEGKQISIPDANGKPAGAFYVAPAKGSKVAIIMIHEFWGLNDHIKKEAEHMHAETGYAVLAVDLYEGKVATDAKVASGYMAAVDQARATAIVTTRPRIMATVVLRTRTRFQRRREPRVM